MGAMCYVHKCRTMTLSNRRHKDETCRCRAEWNHYYHTLDQFVALCGTGRGCALVDNLLTAETHGAHGLTDDTGMGGAGSVGVQTGLCDTSLTGSEVAVRAGSEATVGAGELGLLDYWRSDNGSSNLGG